MLERVKTFWIWMRRFPRSHGFGVQSPSAYSFIRYVINESYPYYAYEVLETEFPELSRREHRMGRLLLRLANYWQPLSHHSNVSVYAPYIYAGCRGSVLKTEVVDRQLVIVDWAKDCMDAFWTAIIPFCTKQTLLVVIGIHQDRQKLEAWKRLQDSHLTGVTYDLYLCGIVFFDKDIFKQHYKVFY